MYSDPSGNFPILLTMIIVGAVIGGGLGGYTATQNGAELGSQEFWIGVGTGALIGAAVGTVAGLGGAYLAGGLASAGNKLISDVASSIFYGANNFGSWEDYAVAFVIGGFINGSGATGGVKLVLDAFARPGLNQVTKMGTRGAEFNRERFAFDVVTRTLTMGMGGNTQVLGLELNPSKAIIRGLFSGMGKEIYG